MKIKERKLTRLFTAIMATLILLVSLPMYAFANEINSMTSGENKNIETAISNESKIERKVQETIVLNEEISLREENVKHFKLSDGTIKAVAYSQAVHYLDENGKWVDIDNALSLSGNEYSAKNKSEIKFANKSGSNGLLSIKDGEYKIDLTPLDTNKVSVEIENPQENNSRKFDDVKKLSKLVSKATYKNIYDGIDLEYILTGNNVKENIIVNSKQESYIYTFELKLNKLNAELVDNSIALYDSDTGEKMYIIPAPYMYDSEGELSQEVEYTLTKNNKWKYTLTVEASKEWINSEERSFPVTIDPTIVANTMVTDDCYTSDEDANATMQYMIVGNFMGYKNVTSYINFQTIPTVPQGNKFVKATASVFVSYVDKPSNYTFLIGVYEAKTNWQNSQTWDSSNTENYLERQLSDTVSITTTGIYEWDISTLYNKWLTENDGMCLRAVGLEQGTSARIHITTSEALDSPIPQLELTYVSHIGVEDYYGYAYNTLGLYGKSYINLYNGSLTYINHLTTISNGNLTYDINMVYNSIEQAWKPSFNENIKLYDDDGIERYIWTDADGTKHWFTPYMEKNYWGQYLYYNVSTDGTKTQTTTPTEFYPEDDIDYVLTKTTNNELILKDYQGNQKLFDENGRLLRICDSYGNVEHFCYLNDKLQSIAYVLSDGTTINQINFYYNDNNQLRYLYDSQNNVEALIYWDGANITSIEYCYLTSVELAQIEFEYNDLQYLTKVTDTKDEYIESYSYENNLINTILQYYYIDNYDNIHLQYGAVISENNTKIILTNYGNDCIVNTNDDIISEHSFDSKGRKESVSIGNNTENFAYNDSVFPDNVYYSTAFSSNIHTALGHTLIGHDMATGETEYICFSSSVPAQSLENNEMIEAQTTNMNDEFVSPLTIIQPDDMQPVENTMVDPYNSICFIKTYYYDVYNFTKQIKETRVFVASGFLVGPNLLMTAGHVLYTDVTVDTSDEGGDNYDDNENNPRFPDKIVVYPGAYLDENQNLATPYGGIEVEYFYIQKEYYNNESTNYDWGVCILEESIGTQVGWFDISENQNSFINEEITVIGYPAETRVEGSMYYSEGVVTYETNYKIYYDADTSGGVSGSPVFVNGENYIVKGIHTSGFNDKDDSTYLDYNKATKINFLIFAVTMSLRYS